MTVTLLQDFVFSPLHLESRFNQTAEYEGQQPRQQDKAVCEDETAEGKELKTAGLISRKPRNNKEPRTNNPPITRRHRTRVLENGRSS